MTPRQILSVAEIGAADRAAIAAGTPGVVLMERAGQAVTDEIVRRFSPRPTVVLCGPGNNGGDGYVVARLLKDRGWPVKVMALSPPQTGDAKAAAAQWDGETGPLTLPIGGELVVDALFGVGLARALSGEAAAASLEMADRAAEVVAVDIPSGLPGDSAQPAGPCASAGLTITFHARKFAHALEPGRSRCGEVV